MSSAFSRYAFLLVPCMLSACSFLQQTTNVHQPMTARPVPPAQAVEATGSIFSASSRSLFEDRRARYIGDTLTINLVEKNQASKSSNASANRASSVEMAAPVITGVMGKNLATNMSATAGADQTFAGKGGAAANNAFTGTVTVTVIEVYPNGNLLVSGEKQVAINQGQEFIRFSGVVNPTYVTSSNTVQSTQVADARVEYKASGYMDEAQTMGWMQRIFMNVLPF
ncbi:flagellar basal body L-ring protein FlgH [Uliginosibacterium sp. 31-16]|uniref:flagellar basal body L-ring protein FlgH n=1 Tax=Uliginosibacterium sp. 31-16 TaxID=3068315 RepID=UPI00273E70EA|nr:flagellar basal body L-ring protein FlgH [Uliginosibacterium sp. 31-16]MDP5240626.1 flagellar basal body L-ring protein FlgH [Uliginosibacterium sp. 31-16]